MMILDTRRIISPMAENGTRAERAYQRIRSDILTGRLLPGQRLLFNELGARYGASMGVLREALTRLAEQRLVVSQPQQGFHVTPVIPEDLNDLTDARVEIETLVFRKAMQSGDLAWEARLVAAHHVLDGTPQLIDGDAHEVNEEWATAHTEFHRILLAACPNRRLREFAATLRDASEVYRRWSRRVGGEQGRDIPGEHRALAQAAISRDIDGGVALLARHIEYTTNAVLASGQFSTDGAPLAEPAESRPSETARTPVQRRSPGASSAHRHQAPAVAGGDAVTGAAHSDSSSRRSR